MEKDKATFQGCVRSLE